MEKKADSLSVAEDTQGNLGVAKECDVDISGVTFIYLEVGYTDRLIGDRYAELFKRSRYGLCGHGRCPGYADADESIAKLMLGHCNRTDEWLREFYVVAAHDGKYSPTVAKEYKHCQVFDQEAFSFLKGSWISPSDCVIISGEKFGEDNDDPNKALPIEELYETIDIGVALDCIKKLQKLGHCGCLGPYPQRMRIYNVRGVKIMYLTFDTESG